MVKYLLISFVLVSVMVKTGLGYFRKYSERNICNRSLALGDSSELYAVEIDFDFLFNQYKKCWTIFQIPDAYSVSYWIDNVYTVTRACNTSLNITYSGDNYHYYPFCNYPIVPSDPTILQNPGNVTVNFQYDRDSGSYQMLLYIFKTGQTCGGNTVRCQNGRCIDHKLYCYASINFCQDDSPTGRCSDDGTKLIDEFEYNKLSIIGPICLSLFGVLVAIFTMYFCFKSSHIRKICGLPTPSQRRSRRQLTARDVYIINVNDASGTPEEGYDYVIDYKKFAAPPDYNSLENIAEATVRYTNNRSDDAPTVENQNSDQPDGATTGGHSNEGFIAPEDDDLPNYDHVMTNSEQFGVNNNHL